ncbi:MAG: hypothetical protein ACXVEF_15840 [Polyangiales bacterium]
MRVFVVVALVFAPLVFASNGGASNSGAPVPSVSAAPTPSTSAEQLALARTLFMEGVKLFDEGDYSGAYQKFGQAAQLKNTPQIRINIARCLEKLGYLISAVEELRGAAADAKALGKDSIESSAIEMAKAIEPKIAYLVVKPDPATAKVTIDGIVGKDRKLDPGAHEVIVIGDKTVKTKVTLSEGEKKTLSISAK